MTTSDSGSVPQPGWYPDPSGGDGQRWWDGEQWGVNRPPVEPTVELAEQPGHAPAPYPSPPTPSPGRSTRSIVTYVAAGVAVLALIIGIVVVTRDDSASPPAGEVSSATVGRSGGTLRAPTGSGGEVQLDLPVGAVPDDVDIAISTRSVEWGSVAEMTAAEADVATALATYAVSSEDSLLHPLYGPAVLPEHSEIAATAVELEPDGLRLDRPATLTLPAGDFGLATGDEVYLFVRSDGAWEVVEAGIVSDQGELSVEIEHFSTDYFVRILGNIWDNPMMHPSRQAYRDALDVIYAGPLEGQAATIQRALLCGPTRQFDAGAVPSLDTVLNYLGFESTRISTAPAGASNRLRDQLRAIADASRAQGVNEPHNVDLGTLVTMAMAETNNDVFQALVLAHDVLRDNRNDPRVQGVMANVRGDGGDERGGRYHILGMAIYSFAYQHQTETSGEPWWPPSPETAAVVEEAWVSGDINSDTVEYALDRYGARLGRTLLANHQMSDERRREMCEYLDLVVPTTTVAPAAPATPGPTSTPASTAPGETTTSVAIPTTTTTIPASTTTTSPSTTTTSTTTTTTSTTTTTTEPPPSTIPEGLGGGDIQATLQWTGGSDMDLHVIDPAGEEIYYSARTSSSGGELDRDAIPSCDAPENNVENIFWPPGGAPSGEYSVFVYAFRTCDAPQTVQLTVQAGGQIIHQQTYTLAATGDSTPPFVFSAG